VTRATSQTVSGINYHVDVELAPAGVAHFTIYEQAWTQTLEVSSATFAASSPSSGLLGQVHHTDLLGGASLALDAASFATFHAAQQQPAAVAGGHTALPASEYAPGSRIASLAAFALDAVKGQSNNLDVQSRTFGRVTRATSQTVSGINYHVDVELAPAGVAHFTIYEQAWTQTLEVSSATFAASSPSSGLLGQVHHTDLLGGTSLALDAAAFAALTEGTGATVLADQDKSDQDKGKLGASVDEQAVHDGIHPALLISLVLLLALVAYLVAAKAREMCFPVSRARLFDESTLKSHEMQVSTRA